MSRVAYVPIQMEASITDSKHLVTMEWVKDFIVGKVKAPVRVVSTTNLFGTYTPGVNPDPVTRGTFTLGSTGALIIDGVTLAVGNRVLLAGQINGVHNGIYVVTDAGSASTEAELQRAQDFDRDEHIFSGVRINVVEGTNFGTSTWALATSGTIILDTTPLEFIIVASTSSADKFATTITGNDVITVFGVTHNLGTTDVLVKVNSAVTNREVITDVIYIDNNTVGIGFASPPTAAQSFRVIVIG